VDPYLATIVAASEQERRLPVRFFASIERPDLESG